MIERRTFGQVVHGPKVAIFEFDREQLEDLYYMYPAGDLFREDVREAMMWLDEQEAE